jgi:hypothetical protein
MERSSHSTLDPNVSIIPTDTKENETYKSAQTRGGQSGLPFSLRSPFLFTFEIGERLLLWTAAPSSRKHEGRVFKGATEVGYGDFEELAQWFDQFWESVGSSANHDIHMLISGQELLQRSFAVPVVPKSELGAVVRSQAKKVYPFDIAKGLLGWKIIDSFEWAGGPKHRIYSEFLGERWPAWFNRLLGKMADNISLVTSSGQVFEYLLRTTDADFAAGDCLLIRLKLDVVETGCFHNGYLEFYREAQVDSLADGGTVGELKRIVGIDTSSSEDEDQNSAVVAAELKNIVRDALDYYQGQFGARKLSTVYLCMPCERAAALVEHIEESLSAKAVSLCESSRVAVHCKLAGISLETDGYCQWSSTLPLRKPKKSTLNLIPEPIKQKKAEAHRFHLSLFALAWTLVLLIVLSLAKFVETKTIRDEISERRAALSKIEAAPELSFLTQLQQRAAEVKRCMQGFEGSKEQRFDAPFKVLSQVSRTSVRLTEASAKYQSNGSAAVTVSGQVGGPTNTRETELFRYVADMAKHPRTKNVHLAWRGDNEDETGRTTEFRIEMEVSK